MRKLCTLMKNSSGILRSAHHVIWKLNLQTACLYSCTSCQRIVPHPEIRFRLVVIAVDSTGSLEVILRDKEVRTVIAKRA